VHPRDLHSFPTRRSSDLEAMLILPGLAFAIVINSGTVLAGTDGWATITNGKSTTPHTGVISRSTLNGRLSNNDALTMPEDVRKRSEEHTSELQSQSNLVC